MAKMTTCSLLCLISLVLQLITPGTFAQLSSDVDINAVPITEEINEIQHLVTTPNKIGDNIREHEELHEGTGERRDAKEEFLEVNGKYNKSGNKEEPLSKSKADSPKIVQEFTPAVNGKTGVSETSSKPVSAKVTPLFFLRRPALNGTPKTFEARVKDLQIPKVLSANDMSAFIRSNDKTYVSSSGEQVQVLTGIGNQGLFIVYGDGQVIMRFNTVENGVSKVDCMEIPESVWKMITGNTGKFNGNK